jgi:acetyl esterase
VDRDHLELIGDGRALTARIYAPLNSSDATLPGLIFFHGGGLVSGGLDSHDALCATLSALGRCRVVAIDYRLAPEARFPAAHEDALAAVRAVGSDPARYRVDPVRLAVGGDSAGGNLAVFAARHAGVSLCLQWLLCPVLDFLARTPSRRDDQGGLLIDEPTLERFWDFYRVEGLSPDDRRVAPLRETDFSMLPPALIHTAAHDPLRDEGALYARALNEAGVEARLEEHAGLIHHFHSLTGIIPAADAAVRRIAAGLAEAFAKGLH